MEVNELNEEVNLDREKKRPFHKDGAESEDGSPAPPRAKAKAKALKAKRVMLKGVHSHTKIKILTSPTF